MMEDAAIKVGKLQKISLDPSLSVSLSVVP